MRRRLEVVMALALLATLPGLARSQVSPGPLSRAHHDLEGNQRCRECHGAGREAMDGQCMKCHTEIAWLVENGRGLHGREGKAECAGCHPEHAGEEFDLVSWGKRGQEGFDHARTGWPLRGRHATRRCTECHRESLQVAPNSAKLKGRVPSESWLGLERECSACHVDPHQGRFGAACASCHTEEDWRKVDRTRFDHERTRYPLRGRHAQLACVVCHDPVKAWGERPAFTTCNGCHADPHRGAATLAGRKVDCESCHAVDGFRPSRFSVADHAAGAYPLAGAHRRVACLECHRGEGTGPPGSTFRFRLPHERCTDCHEPAHGKQLADRIDRGECSVCHRVEGWIPSTFDAAAHAAAGFELVEGHAKPKCADCHASIARGSLAASDQERVGRAGVALTVSTKCLSCHRDPHEARYAESGDLRFADGCWSCHSRSTFVPSRIGPEEHKRLGYVLEGAHLAVACNACHGELDRPRCPSTLASETAQCGALRFTSKRDVCKDCHEDPHAGQFATRTDGGACEGCHDLERFRPARRFDHERGTRFPLAGAHARVPCARCHPSETDDAGGTYVRYRPLSIECRTCHAEGTPVTGEGRS